MELGMTWILKENYMKETNRTKKIGSILLCYVFTHASFIIFYYVILTYITVPSCFYVVQFDPILCDGFIFFVQPRHWHIWPTVFCFWYVERRTYIKRDLFHLIVFISFLYNLLRVLMSNVKLVVIDVNVSIIILSGFPSEFEYVNTWFSILHVLLVI